MSALSEEGAKSRNKFYRRDRLFHAKNDSRAHNIQDVFLRAFLTSDPVILSYYHSNETVKKRKTLPYKVQELLDKTDSKNESNIFNKV